MWKEKCTPQIKTTKPDMKTRPKEHTHAHNICCWDEGSVENKKKERRLGDRLLMWVMSGLSS